MAATAMDAFLADVSATVNFLNGMKTLPNFDSIRMAQLQAMLARLAQLSSIPANQASTLLEAWNTGPWTAEESKRFTDAVSAAVAASTQGTPRKGKRPNQNIRDFQPFLSTRDVHVLRGEASMSVKMDVLATRCVRLKLTLPSENGIKMIVASGLSWSNAVSDADRYMNVLEFKRLLHSKRKPVPKAGLHLTEYPGHPRELPQELFLQAYDKDDPPAADEAASPLRVQEEVDGIAVRGTSKKVRHLFNTGGTSSALVPQGAPCLQAWAQAAPQAVPNNQAQTMLAMMQMVMQQSMQGQRNFMPAVPGLTIFEPKQQAAQQQVVAHDDVQNTPEKQPHVVQTTPHKHVEQSQNLFQTELEDPPALDNGTNTQDDEAVLKQAAMISDAIDKRGGRTDKTSDKWHAAKGKGKGRGRGKGKGKGKGKAKAKAQPKAKAHPKPKAKAPPKPKANAQAKSQTMKRPAAAGTREFYRQMSMSKRKQLRPHGCQKCRGKPGCTPSCFADV